MGNQFKNKVALVTGGSKGIGRAIVERFAKEGANLAIIDIDKVALIETEKEFKKLGYDIYTEVANVAEVENVEVVIKKIVDTLGSIDIVVNNAGIIRDNLLFKMTDEDWDSVMNVHLKGTFNVTRAVQKYMVENKYGRIINLSSTSALGNRGQTNYSAAKAGLQGLTKTLSIELGKYGITANAVAPGFIETDMTKATAERIGMSFEQFMEQQASLIPVKRSGVPEDIANAVAFFADERSSFISGQVLYVAGGPTN